MKILNIEDGREVIYVQKADLELINDDDKNMFTTMPFFKVDDEWQNPFFRFTDPNEIQFFKSKDWIISYRAVNRLSCSEIKEELNAVEAKIQFIVRKHNSTIDGKIRKDYEKTLNLLRNKLHSLQDVLWFKLGYSSIPFPEVPDSFGCSILSIDNSPYQMQTSFDPKKIILFKSDGKPFSKSEHISDEFIRLATELQEIDIFEKRDIDKKISPDGRYLIISPCEMQKRRRQKGEGKNLVEEIVGQFDKLANKIEGSETQVADDETQLEEYEDSSRSEKLKKRRNQKKKEKYRKKHFLSETEDK